MIFIIINSQFVLANSIKQETMRKSYIKRNHIFYYYQIMECILPHIIFISDLPDMLLYTMNLNDLT